MKRKVAEIILILLFYLIQVTFGNAIGIGGITPNLLIILPVLFGFFKGRNEGYVPKDIMVSRLRNQQTTRDLRII